MQQYWLIKVDSKYVGVTGLYSYKEFPDDIWLAWFGILKPERRKGYATATFKKMLKKSKENGYQTLRLYTDKIENSDAVCFYKKMGMTSEIYVNPKDPHDEEGGTLIFSMSVQGNPVPNWDNKYLYLHERDERNNI